MCDSNPAAGVGDLLEDTLTGRLQATYVQYIVRAGHEGWTEKEGKMAATLERLSRRA